MRTHHKVSVITVVYNEAANIQSFLDSYKEQSIYGDEFVIVDGGSEDSTVKIITNFSEKNPALHIKLIVDKTLNRKYCKGPIAKSRNIAISQAKGEIIAVTDAGCLLEKNWLEELIKPFENKEIYVVGGAYNAAYENFLKPFFIPNFATIEPSRFLPSSRNIAFKKECWVRVSGYPETIYTGEDTAFDLEIKKHYQIHLAKKSVVNWMIPLNIKEAKKKMYSYGYGDGQLLQMKMQFFKWLLFTLFPINLLYKYRFKIEKLHIGYLMLLSYEKGYLMGAKNRIGK